MAEEQKTFKLPYVKPETQITLEVSGTFLNRCQTLLMGLAQHLGQEKTIAIMEKFKETNTVPENLDEVTIFVLTALVGEMENQAVKQGKVEYKEVTADELARSANGN